MKRDLARPCAAAILALAAAAGAARADVTISAHATAHMSCVANVCTATGAKAYLNAGDLQTMLGSAGVTVKSTAAAPDIRITVPLSWSSTFTLGLDSYRGVDVQREISVLANGGLAVTLNDGGSGGQFAIDAHGNVHFWSLAGSLVINGNSYTLVSNVASLASGVTATPNGNFALAADYNAGPDGEYYPAPVATTLTGRFEGLGNVITNLTIRGGNRGLALFHQIDGSAENIVLKAMKIHSTGNTKASAGGLAAINNGKIFNAHANGKISATGNGATQGGLVAFNNGTIARSSAHNVPQIGSACDGGVVGKNAGTVRESWATGRAYGVQAGGVACDNTGTIVDSYNLAEVGGRQASPYPGSLVATNEASGSIVTSYAAGQVTAVSNFGGVAGTNLGSLSQVYWDQNYTGAGPGFGCGSGSCSGATGLTHAQITAALPTGFDPAIWGLDPAINNGWPYLLTNPPQ